jgi:hypothetical protein
MVGRKQQRDLERQFHRLLSVSTPLVTLVFGVIGLLVTALIVVAAAAWRWW